MLVDISLQNGAMFLIFFAPQSLVFFFPRNSNFNDRNYYGWDFYGVKKCDVIITLNMFATSGYYYNYFFYWNTFIG